MLLTNILDFMTDSEGQFLEDAKFHIPYWGEYEELAMPFSIDLSTGVILDSKDRCVILSVDLIESLDWEVF